MSAAPLVPGPVYGLRTWAAVGAQGQERLAGPRQETPWPVGGAWLEARCEQPHAAPAPDCECGIHAWHPTRSGARRVLASWREVAGVVEAEGAIEVHQDGFRAERARPYALLVGPHANTRLVRRLADAYGVDAVGVDGPDAIVAWCRARGLGLDSGVVETLLGPDAVAAARGERRRRARTSILRVAAALAAIAVLVWIGLSATSNPGDRTLHGRTGEVHVR